MDIKQIDGSLRLGEGIDYKRAREIFFSVIVTVLYLIMVVVTSLYVFVNTQRG